MNEDELRKLMGVGTSDQAIAGATDLARQIARATNTYRTELGDAFSDAERQALTLAFQNSFVAMLTAIATLMAATSQKANGA